MNYYKRHIGDYSTGASHLSLIEHGVYNVLIDHYYGRELAPTKAEAIRRTRATTDVELAAVDAVLTEFFTEIDGRFTQKRVEEELAAFRVKQEANRILGARGGQANGKRIATETLSETEAKQVSNQQANDKPSHKPLASNQEEATATPSAGAECPHADILDLYHEILPVCRRMKVWNGARMANLRSRWREDAKRQSLDYWKRFFHHVAKSDFLTGRTASKDRAPFIADLEWLVTAGNFAKVIEGKYHESR